MGSGSWSSSTYKAFADSYTKKSREEIFHQRSYLTRHGKGPVGDSIFKEINNPYETNLNNPFQGEFQTYEFNKELVLYGIDHVKSHFNPEYKVRLIETCCDICAGHDLGIPYNYSIKTCKKNFDSVCK